MKKTIIISEAKFKQLTNFLILEDKSMDNAFMRFEKYKELGDDFFKNPNINDGMKAKDSSTYNIALKKEMDDVVETIYSVFEKISHNLGATYSKATNEDPKDGEKVTYGKNKWMHPSTFYVEDDIVNARKSDKKDFLYKCRCYYTLILRVYNGGVPVWANLFFNPKYKSAKMDFIKCNKISTGKLARISVGVLDKSTNKYPEGSINWIRNRRAISAVDKTYGESSPILDKDFQPATFGQEQYSELIPKKEKSAIMQWFIKAQKDPTMYEPYLIDEPKQFVRKRFGNRI